MGPLPSFLQPLENSPKNSPDIPCQNAQFTQIASLGSSHVLWWPPSNENCDPDTLLYFIPGNPGLVDFYRPFLSEIHANQASSNFAVIAKAHLDHYPGIQNKGDARYRPEESLTIQVQSSLELLGAITSFYTKKLRIIIVGHSVGSWISLQVLKALPDAITAVFLLFPTISNIGDTPNGRLLSPIFLPLSRSILSSLSILAKHLPDRVLSILHSGWPAHQLRVLQEFISSRGSVMASLSMAHEEMKAILALDTILLENHKDKLYFYYAELDGWVGKERETLLQTFDPSKHSTRIMHGTSGIPHAFCINHGEILAKHCCEWLDAMPVYKPPSSNS
ncbi:hypothetical protein BDZ97DRAFT_1775751 [Flammula alnicola]|nr:hypothetical protein BDZ97DRAFT_1775751 [Flammula alnicola]